MENKKNKKKKVLKILLLILIIIAFVFYLKELKIKNIYIIGNKTIKDYEIIELAGIENYPNMFSISTKKMINKIKINPLVKNVSIKKNLFGKIVINIEEHNMLLKYSADNKIYLENGSSITNENDVVGIPSLINVVDDNVLKKFLTKLNKIDFNVFSKISEISYSPNEYDKDLFIFLMNDGNYVYITTSKLSNINKYESILVSLEGKKGIIYLDSGNHFEPFS